MKYTYNTPKIELLEISTEDILTASLASSAMGAGDSVNCGDWSVF